MPAKTAKTTDPVQTESPRHIIGFRLRRNVLLPALAAFTAGGVFPTPPMRVRELRSVAGFENTERPLRKEVVDPFTKIRSYAVSQASPIVPHFNMEYVHEIALEPTEPRTIVKQPGQTDERVAKLQDAEYARCLAAKSRMSKLRAALVHYSTPLVEGAPPAIEIVDDPTHFMDEESSLSAADLAAEKDATDTARFQAGVL